MVAMHNTKRRAVALLTIGSQFLLALPTTVAATYQYDSLNRLTRAVYDDGTSVAYTYDGIGNRTRKVVMAHVPADFDRDGDVDILDFGIFQACATGPGVEYDPMILPAPAPGCTLKPNADGMIDADLNVDGTVDMEDFAIFQRCWSGSLPADPNCAD